jgi:hypothetical protein
MWFGFYVLRGYKVKGVQNTLFLTLGREKFSLNQKGVQKQLTKTSKSVHWVKG